LREGIAELSELVNGQVRPVTDREGAQRLVNLKLFADRESLPPPEEEEFYLADLIGLEAVGADGVSLGRIAAVHDYGAGASLEIGELMVPFTRQAVPEVDVAAGRVVVMPPVEIASPSPLEGEGRGKRYEPHDVATSAAPPAPPARGGGKKESGVSSP
jgi:16S rRNA processing protein RimM